MEAFDAYRTLAAPSEGLFKDNGSRFIALAYPVETEEEVKAVLASLLAGYQAFIGANHIAERNINNALCQSAGNQAVGAADDIHGKVVCLQIVDNLQHRLVKSLTIGHVVIALSNSSGVIPLNAVATAVPCLISKPSG